MQYFEQAIGLEFIEQFISKVLAHFVRSESLENTTVISYVLGTLRLMILI
jgi:hypothetical protein